MDTTNYRGLTEEQIEHKLKCLEAELFETYGIIPEQIQVDEDNQLYFTSFDENGNPGEDGYAVDKNKNYIEDKYEALI